MLSSHKSLLLVGLGGLLHAGYTATQYRTFIRLTSQEFTALPSDIVVYTLLCLALTCYALIQVVCTFREVRSYEQSAHLSWDSLFHRQSLISFNHRAKILSGCVTAHSSLSLSEEQLLFGNTSAARGESDDREEAEEEQASHEQSDEEQETR